VFIINPLRVEPWSNLAAVGVITAGRDFSGWAAGTRPSQGGMVRIGTDGGSFQFVAHVGIVVIVRTAGEKGAVGRVSQHHLTDLHLRTNQDIPILILVNAKY